MEKIKILFFIPTLGHGGAERVLIKFRSKRGSAISADINDISAAIPW